VVVIPPTRLIGAVLVLMASVLVSCSVVSTDSPSQNAEVPGPAIDVSGGLSETDDRTTAAGAADIDSVVMIGDSITNGARSFLEERFELLGLDHVVEAVDGKRMASSSSDNPSGADVAAWMVENGDGDHTDEVWVIALGTNDIGNFDTGDEIAAAVDEVLAEVPDEVGLVWVDTWISARPEQSAEVNAVIRERVRQRDASSVLAPWTAVAEDEGVLTNDGVHPTTAGADVFAFVVTDTVRRFLAR
jgi:lysophospholipase L1-like esterase